MTSVCSPFGHVSPKTVVIQLGYGKVKQYTQCDNCGMRTPDRIYWSQGTMELLWNHVLEVEKRYNDLIQLLTERGILLHGDNLEIKMKNGPGGN